MDKEQKEGRGSFPPWSRVPSLSEMTIAAGIDFDQFINCLQHDYTTAQIAGYFQVSDEVVESLKEHFFKYGISSVMGGD